MGAHGKSLTQRVPLRRGIELGAVDYMIKPFSHPALQARVTAALERSRVDSALVPAAATAPPFPTGMSAPLLLPAAPTPPSSLPILVLAVDDSETITRQIA